MIQEIIFNTGLKKSLLKMKFTQPSVIRDEVIPMLTVLHAMLRIRDIDDRKRLDLETE